MQNTHLLRRLGAMLYDTLLVLALVIMTTYLFIAFNGGEAIETDGNQAFQLTLALVVYVFFVGFWSRPGRTLGMQAWRLHLESRDGGDIGVGTASIRFFAAILSWAPAGLGFLWSLWDKDRLTWHDRISKTQIVHYPKTAPGNTAPSESSTTQTE